MEKQHRYWESGLCFRNTTIVLCLAHLHLLDCHCFLSPMILKTLEQCLSSSTQGIKIISNFTWSMINKMMLVNFLKYLCYHDNLKYHVLDMTSWKIWERNGWGHEDIQKTWRGKERARICMKDHSDKRTEQKMKTKGNIKERKNVQPCKI